MNNEKRPSHIDVFSGIGGFSIAFQAEGFETIGFFEIEPYPCAVLKKHWPQIPNYGSITGTLPGLTCDVLTGGFPCQPFSCAGKRGGKDDDRFLWPAMLDAIAKFKPAWVLGENVTGIIGMELDRCQSDLENLGYEVQSFVVPACAVDAKHKRARVWIVGYSKHNGRTADKITGGSHARGNDSPQGENQGLQPARSGRELLADTGRKVLEGQRKIASGVEAQYSDTRDTRDTLPHPIGKRKQQPKGSKQEKRGRSGDGCETIASDAMQGGLSKPESQSGESGSTGTSQRPCVAGRNRRTIIPDVRGMADGLPEKLDGYPFRWESEDQETPRIESQKIPNRAARLKGLGNAVVPQVVQVFARAIYTQIKAAEEKLK